MKTESHKQRYINFLLFFIVALLPFAEWTFIGLPLRGRPIVIDFNSYLSVSVFDLVFICFAAACIPLIWRAYRKKYFFNWYLLWWAFCGILIIILLIQQKPIFPYLNLTSANVIDVRSCIVHFAVAIFVTIAVTQLPFASIVRGSKIFYLITSFGAAILCYFALTANMFFKFNYPFNTPSSISFPFPNQNVAAIFMVLCFVGVIGVAVTRNLKMLLLLFSPIFLLAAALTGSRSSMFICCLTIFAYVIIYVVYYRKITLGCESNFKSSHPTTLLIALCIGFVLIFLNIDWHPIRRSMSIFHDAIFTPKMLLTGGENTPRNQLWCKTVESIKLKNKPETDNVSQKINTFSLGLISIENGCKNISNNTHELKIGKPYYIRLTLTPNGTNAHLAVLNVFEDSNRRQLVDSIEMTFNLPQLSNIYYFIADSDSKFVFIEAELSAFTKKFGSETDENCLKYKTVRSFEEPFNGGAQPIILLEDNCIRFKANPNRLRGYISKTDRNYDNKNKYILEYTVNVKNARYSQPLDLPVMFYVGFGESTNDVKNKDNWKLIRNGLLIKHERSTNAWQKDINLSNQKEKLYWLIGKDKITSGIDHLKLFNNEVRCGKGGYNFISSLWEPIIPEGFEVKELNRKYRDIYRINSENDKIESVCSTIPDQQWSADDNLADRGSTHNVYLDWYYYVGPIPFGIFLILIISLLGAFAHFTWKSRFSEEFPFILSVFCQLLIVAALMYAHPYIWLKYIWFVFGLATAVMIHPDLNKKMIVS